MITIAKRYQKGHGVKTAPTGMQNLLEPVITFVRDEVAKPNLGNKWEKYLPYILTVFFFILINNLFGLIPGSANVTGNIAFTLILGLISFIVILASSKKHYWGHIFNPPGMPIGSKTHSCSGGVSQCVYQADGIDHTSFCQHGCRTYYYYMSHFTDFYFCRIKYICGLGNFDHSQFAFTIFIYFIEILVAFIQAYIFAMLTAVFIGQAFEEAIMMMHMQHIKRVLFFNQ